MQRVPLARPEEEHQDGRGEPHGEAVAADLDRAFESLGFPSEGRVLTPHLTLARFKLPVPLKSGFPSIDTSGVGGFEFQVLDQTGTNISALANATQAVTRAGMSSTRVRALFSPFTANDPQLVVYQLALFVRNVRTVTTDPTAQVRFIEDAYALGTLSDGFDWGRWRGSRWGFFRRNESQSARFVTGRRAL